MLPRWAAGECTTFVALAKVGRAGVRTKRYPTLRQLPSRDMPASTGEFDWAVMLWALGHDGS